MSISIIASNATNAYLSLASGSGAAAQTTSVLPSLAKDETDTVSISAEGLRRADSDNANGSGASYDFTNISQQQLQAATSDLFKSGKMSFDDLSLSVGMIQSPLAKVDYDGKWPDTYTKPMNVLSTLSDGLDAARSRGDSSAVKNISQLLSAFERVQGTAKG